MLLITEQFVGCGISYVALGIVGLFTKLFQNVRPCCDTDETIKTLII